MVYKKFILVALLLFEVSPQYRHSFATSPILTDVFIYAVIN